MRRTKPSRLHDAPQPPSGRTHTQPRGVRHEALQLPLWLLPSPPDHLSCREGIDDIELFEVEVPRQPERWPPGIFRGLILYIGNGTRIGQLVAILECLEEHKPTPNLIGATSGPRSSIREMVAILHEAAWFFVIWARQGSRLNVDRHTASLDAAVIETERFGSKVRVAETLIAGPFLTDDTLTIADCVAMALLECADQFYGVALPSDCPKLRRWYAPFSERPSNAPPDYPVDMKRLAHGLAEQSRCTA